MKRKNCTVSVNTPAALPGGTCDDNPAGRLRGTDPNRNYPGFWGGPGASAELVQTTPTAATRPATTPEVDAVRELISQRQVTNLITNHTYSNLVLRPPSLSSTGYRARRAAVQGARRPDGRRPTTTPTGPSYQLYDTSGTTEDWSYWNTGGFGFTFEIGPDGFHPAVRGRRRRRVPRPGARGRRRQGRQPRGLLPDGRGHARPVATTRRSRARRRRAAC